MKYRLFIAGVLCAVPAFAFAANPSVGSLIAGSSSINSGQIASFSWRTTDSGGYSFVIPCAQGIKLKKTDGGAFACDTPITSVATTIDGIDLIAWNLSGATKSFTARVTPKDATGADYSYGRQDISVSVAPVAQPIESITGTTTITSKDAYTLSWSSSILDGTNLSISCANNIRTTSPSYTGYLPCNKPIFTSDLAGSGSLSLVFDNSAAVTDTITLTLYPAMASGIYSGAGARSITVSVNPIIIPDPVTTSFTASDTSGRALTTTPITLSWVTEKSSGVNFQISCNDNITTTITANGTSSTPKCSAPTFNTALPASGSATISFGNKSSVNEPITVTLTPGRLGGGYDATRGKSISFLVLPVGASTTTAPTITEPKNILPSTPATPSAAPQPSGAAAPKTSFTRYLTRGSSNADVRALQTFLAKDVTLYPEGVVSGYFGPATERAVKRLQEKYNIARPGAAGYGAVGPKTRTLLNSLN